VCQIDRKNQKLKISCYCPFKRRTDGEDSDWRGGWPKRRKAREEEG
jgi:hypothetical protein